ncbi:pyridoxamine 5'-phosphate oxidase family protein [Dactylosporangium sucinum]|uniref:Oxidoreductase n=1 Tax=Dactylosporangium sucinum TaxID=1424081 RepID=A0A917SZ97_9ACTN|nr:pyridoxamine 5'-phosphate oxidase family protein [Dactylosporangium sucinum]GGM03510.1 oxidoreductase [Dactylosporangium sucinum]
MEHAGERAVRLRAGAAVEAREVGAAVPAVAARFLGEQRLVVIGAADGDGAVWASPLTGPPGFVATDGERTIVVDRLPGAGDPLAGRFGAEHDIGLLAIDPATRRRMRANGRARRTADRLVIDTDQVYANCLKYLQTRYPQGAPSAPTARAARRTGSLSAAQRRRVAAADTFFIASTAPDLGADAAHRGGNPGFVTVTGARHLSWPDYAGNAMFSTLGNLELDGRCGLLFVDWEHGHTLQLTGRARVDWDADRAATTPGAQRFVDFEVEQVVDVTAGLGMRWSFGGYSRFNPPPPS